MTDECNIEDGYNFYTNLWNLEKFYTEIPLEYWKAYKNVSDPQYIKDKMNVDKLTTEVLEDACKKHNEIFNYWMLGIRLRPYQHLAMDLFDNNRYIAMAWGRRLGKSTVSKSYVLKTSVFNQLPGDLTGTTWNIVLQDQEIANTLYIEPLHEIMERADKIVDRNFKGELGDKYFTSKLVTKREKSGKVKSNQISFSTETGISRINTLPPTPKAIGREGNILGDEVAKWKYNIKVRDENDFYDQLIAIMKDKQSYKGLFLSTPEGDQDVFAKEIFDCDSQINNHIYKKIWFPYWARTDIEWLVEIENTRKRAIEKKRLHMFEQEYEAKFKTIEDPFFDYESVIKAQDNNWNKKYSNLPCSLGIDWGGTEVSQTVLSVKEWDLKPESPRKTIYLKAYEVNDDVLNIDKDLMYIKNNYNIKWVVPDNKGGRWMIPKLEQIYGKTRITQFNHTTEKKEAFELYREAIIKGINKLPANLEFIKQIKNIDSKIQQKNKKIQDDYVDADVQATYPLLKTETKKFGVCNIRVPY
jgi:hypothetical protein